MPPISGELAHRCGRLIAAAAGLREQLPPETRLALAPLVEQVNCYYSNLIEGQHTYPDEVEAVLRRARDQEPATTTATSPRPAARSLAIEGAAHIETQRLLVKRLRSDPAWDPTAPANLCELHQWFIERLPAEMRHATSRSGHLTVPIVPGAWRTTPVEVGEHVPPDHACLPAFLDTFHHAYASHTSLTPETLVRIAAAHHRLVWIHPFVDGNGRVARLMTDAMFERAKVGADGLWRISRGFARTNKQYKSLLAAADEQRHHDADGRGNLSQEALVRWCDYMIEQAIDQATFMGSLIRPPELRFRIMRWADRRGDEPRVGRLLCEVMLRGTIERNEAAEILGTSERHALRLINALIRDGVVDTKPHAPLRPRIPLTVAPHWFPDLFPAAIEMRLETHRPVDSA